MICFASLYSQHHSCTAEIPRHHAKSEGYFLTWKFVNFVLQLKNCLSATRRRICEVVETLLPTVYGLTMEPPQPVSSAQQIEFYEALNRELKSFIFSKNGDWTDKLCTTSHRHPITVSQSSTGSLCSHFISTVATTSGTQAL